MMSNNSADDRIWNIDDYSRESSRPSSDVIIQGDYIESRDDALYHTLGLVDEEGLLVLPPEDLGEIDDIVDDYCATSKWEYSPLVIENTSLAEQYSKRKSGFCSKKRRRRKFNTINLSSCKYDSVRRVTRRFGFREVGDSDEWDLYWTDYSVSLERVFAMKTWQKINHFPGMSELCRKDSLARNLGRMAKLFPKEYNIFPLTWCLPSEWNELQMYARKRKMKTFILKPDTGCQGRGIIITRSIKDVRPLDNMICQVYLTKPFLIDGYKFDIRLYVLLTSCDPLRMFMFKDGLVRFTTVQYVEPNQRNMHNMYMHLTNYAVQKHSNDFIRDDEEGGTKRRVTTLNRWFVENGYDLDKIWSDIDDVVIKTVLSGYAVVRHNYRTCFPNHVLTSACFEILGFDIMLNNKLKPFVLEVNHSPSFSTDSRLDKEIKEAMLWDTLRLVHCCMVSKKKSMEDERKRIQNRLIKKTAKKDIREITEKELAISNANAEKCEHANLGNFRPIFPGPETGKYEQFINPKVSFYQETVTYKVRSECARQMREEIRLKQEKTGGSRGKRINPLPESPSPRVVRRPSIIQQQKQKSIKVSVADKIEPTKRSAFPWGDQTSLEAKDSPVWSITSPTPPSWLAQPIQPEEELARLKSLRQREKLLQSLGLVETVHSMLANSCGVSSIIHEDTTAAKPPLSKTQLSRNGHAEIDANTEETIEQTARTQGDSSVPGKPNSFVANIISPGLICHTGRPWRRCENHSSATNRSHASSLTRLGVGQNERGRSIWSNCKGSQRCPRSQSNENLISNAIHVLNSDANRNANIPGFLRAEGIDNQRNKMLRKAPKLISVLNPRVELRGIMRNALARPLKQNNIELNIGDFKPYSTHPAKYLYTGTNNNSLVQSTRSIKPVQSPDRVPKLYEARPRSLIVIGNHSVMTSLWQTQSANPMTRLRTDRKRSNQSLRNPATTKSASTPTRPMNHPTYLPAIIKHTS